MVRRKLLRRIRKRREQRNILKQTLGMRRKIRSLMTRKSRNRNPHMMGIRMASLKIRKGS